MHVTLGNLPERASRTNERYAYVGVEGWDWDGKLTITAGTRKAVSDEYVVLEEEPNGFPGRVFLLKKETGENAGDIYKCSVGAGPDPRTAHWACTCKAGQVRRHRCKHFLALHDRLKQEAPDRGEPTDGND